jgi:hypothetical protein
MSETHFARDAEVNRIAHRKMRMPQHKMRAVSQLRIA